MTPEEWWHSHQRACHGAFLSWMVTEKRPAGPLGPQPWPGPFQPHAGDLSGVAPRPLRSPCIAEETGSVLSLTPGHSLVQTEPLQNSEVRFVSATALPGAVPSRREAPGEAPPRRAGGHADTVSGPGMAGCALGVILLLPLPSRSISVRLKTSCIKRKPKPWSVEWRMDAYLYKLRADGAAHRALVAVPDPVCCGLLGRVPAEGVVVSPSGPQPFAESAVRS